MISDHDPDDLHLHVATRAASVSELLIGESLLGLANAGLRPRRRPGSGVCQARRRAPTSTSTPRPTSRAATARTGAPRGPTSRPTAPGRRRCELSQRPPSVLTTCATPARRGAVLVDDEADLGAGTPCRAPGRVGASDHIESLRHAVLDPVADQAALAGRQVNTSSRGNAIRVSMHGYNDSSDLNRLAEALARVAQQAAVS